METKFKVGDLVEVSARRLLRWLEAENHTVALKRQKPARKPAPLTRATTGIYDLNSNWEG